jgi:glycosyltransferase involved in cell wall biosynthesis
MKTSPLVSVVMPVFNGGKYLSDAIISILNQTFTDFEFIIINDGSTDDSLETIQKFASNDNRIRVINRENKGLVFSLNQGISESKGKYIARMDADDLSNEKRFERQVYLLEKEGGHICGCHFNVISETNKLINNFIAPISTEAIACCLLITNPYAHGSVMLNKQFMLNNGLVYKDIKAEDHRLWTEFYDAGAKFVTVNEFLFSYRVHKNSISKSKEKVMQKEVHRNGDFLVTKFKMRYLRDLESFAKQEHSFLEEQLLLMSAYKYSKVHRSFIFFKFFKQASIIAKVLVFLKIISRKAK